jgi:hypothetical protein
LRVNVASVIFFPPTERNSLERRGRRGEWDCIDRREAGRKLGVEDVASGTEEAKAA